MSTSTNVEKIWRAIKPVDSDGVSQIVYYHSGIGTGDFLDKFVGAAFGEGIDRNILDCYKFLVGNYNGLDDEIYLFGFSRGAYTVRSLAGLIRNSGLLKPEYASMAQEAYSLYRDRHPDKHPNSDAAAQFRKSFAHQGRQQADDTYEDSTPIKCIGVWDTVGALGIPLGLFSALNHHKYSFHDTTLSSRVEFAFHALAIDERRKPFVPTLWEQPLEDALNHRNWLEQAWFTGVHSNVGGGYPDSALSDVTLEWMLKVVGSKTGLQFDENYVNKIAIANYLGHLEDSYSRLFRKLGPAERALGDPVRHEREPHTFTWEYVHETAQQRYEKMKTVPTPWAPHNLVKYLDKQPKYILDRLNDEVVQEILAQFPGH